MNAKRQSPQAKLEIKGTTQEKRTFARVSQADVPRHSLAESIRVARVIEDHYGGKPSSPLDVATSLESTPSSSWFRTITGAAVAFGLTDGAYNAQDVRLTDLGRRVVAPTEEGDDTAAIREALLKPRVVREFLTRYDRKKLPPVQIAQNVLVSLGVAKDAAQRTHDVLLASARDAGVLRKLKGGDEWVDLRQTAQSADDRARASALDDAGHVSDDMVDEPAVTEPVNAEAQDIPRVAVKPIFLGHGKKRGPLEKLEKILRSFQVPYKVAVAEPNLGRPIPTKVKDVMKECGSAILIFSRDERFTAEDGQEIWRPSENVVYELGAASYEYGDRVVIFMEKGLEFPANFESIGHIEFEENSIESKTMELMQELIGLGLLKITPAA